MTGTATDVDAEILSLEKLAEILAEATNTTAEGSEQAAADLDIPPAGEAIVVDDRDIPSTSLPTWPP